jgi:negative regulator of flagellin synthesis FlgM
MKINETQRLGAINHYRQQHEARTDQTGKKAKQKDEISISAEAKELQGSQGTTVNPRVEELKNSVATGTYHVEARKIAEKLLPYLK